MRPLDFLRPFSSKRPKVERARGDRTTLGMTEREAVEMTMKIKKNRHCLGGADFFCTFVSKI